MPERAASVDGVPDGGERVPELVGEHREELVLVPVGVGELGRIRLGPVSCLLGGSCNSPSRSSSSRLRSVMSSMARRISSHFPSGGKRRALSSIVFGPMASKSCSTSKSSKRLFSGRMSSSKVLRAGMSHWPSPRS